MQPIHAYQSYLTVQNELLQLPNFLLETNLMLSDDNRSKKTISTQDLNVFFLFLNWHTDNSQESR